MPTEVAILPGSQQVGDGKQVSGYLDTSLQGDGDVLESQAIRMARARGKGSIVYEGGAEFPDDFVNQVKKQNVPAQYAYQRGVSQDTINALTQGSVQRDQQYVGNNADWTGYYLEPLAKYVVPFDTPVRNMIPRSPSVGIDIENWRAITSVFNGAGPTMANFILTQGGTPKKAQYVWANKSNLLRMLAWSDVVTFETELYSRLFEPDVRAKVAAKLVPSLMLGQEYAYLNGAQQLWAPATPNGGSTATTGGSLAAATYWIIATAAVGTYSGSTFTQTGETMANGGSSPVALKVTTTGSTSTISFNLPRVPSTSRYNVYVGTGSTQPATSAMWLQANVASDFSGSSVHTLDDSGRLDQGWLAVTFIAAETSTTAYSTVYTGSPAVPAVLPVPFSSGSGGTPANQTLTSDGIQALCYTNTGTLSTVGEGGETSAIFTVADAGGALAKSDIDNALEKAYYNARANPEAMLVSPKDHKAISNIVAQSTAFRIMTQPTQAGLSDLVGGARATKWVNQTTGRLIDIIMCPYLTQGTIIFLSLTLPFQVAEIDQPPLRVSVNREMWSVIYPPVQGYMTQWAYGAFCNECVVNQYLGGTFLLNGIVTA